MSYCTQCGAYAGDEAWRRYCRKCFAEQKRQEETSLRERNYELESQIDDLLAEVRRLREKEEIRHVTDVKRVQALLQLCHPDKHGGSELAKSTTQWLLKLKTMLGPR